jgi:hypothetical protein
MPDASRSYTSVGVTDRSQFLGNQTPSEKIPRVDFNDIWEWRLQLLLWEYVSPVLLISGTIFNALTIIVLLQRKFGKTSTRILLVVLALADSAILYTGLLRRYVYVMFGFNLRTSNAVICPLHTFCIYLFRNWASWAVMLVTLERWISVIYPLKAKILCTPRSTSIALVVVLIFLSALNSHLLYYTRLVGEVCDIFDEAFLEIWGNLLNWLDMVTFCGIPFCAVAFCNLSILYKVIRRNQDKHLSKSLNRSTDAKVVHLSSITYMLTTVSVMFVLLTSPVAVFYVFYGYSYLRATTPKQIAQMFLGQTITAQVAYVNNTINFLLYCISGTQFRRAVYRMFCRNKAGN